MSEELQIATRYIFILGALLIFFAYFGGSTKVLSTAGQTIIGLINAGTGRSSTGKFAAYPTGGPTA